MNKYDVIIIGSGLSGLACGVTLSKEGYNVCILEKNSVPGGCFQSFKRNGRILDTGIHYIGSMGEGQILRQYFTYFGIMERLKVRRMDETAFDNVHFKGNIYPYAMGTDNFVESLAVHFPEEKEALRNYTALLHKTGETISVERLREGMLSTGGMEQFSVSAWETLKKITSDSDLREVLSSTALLYGGDRATSTFYHHAMIANSYMEGAYRFVDGSMQLVNAMIDQIKQNGGTILTGTEVTRLYPENNKIKSVEINHTEQLAARYVISSIHPSITMRMVEKSPLIRQAYLSRLSSLPNSYGLFSVYLLQKRNSKRYINRNEFIYGEDTVWYNTLHPEDKQFRCCLLTMQASANKDYTDVICLMSPMHFDMVKEWQDTWVDQRGEAYETFKQTKAEELLRFVQKYFPDINKETEKMYVTTPLTYRDYTGIPEGSAYGIMKNYNNPLATIIPGRTRIPNLFLTGQNLNVHGALGVTLTSMLTCAELVGSNYLAKRVGEA